MFPPCSNLSLHHCLHVDEHETFPDGGFAFSYASVAATMLRCPEPSKKKIEPTTLGITPVETPRLTRVTPLLLLQTQPYTWHHHSWSARFIFFKSVSQTPSSQSHLQIFRVQVESWLGRVRIESQDLLRHFELLVCKLESNEIQHFPYVFLLQTIGAQWNKNGAQRPKNGAQWATKSNELQNPTS